MSLCVRLKLHLKSVNTLICLNSRRSSGFVTSPPFTLHKRFITDWTWQSRPGRRKFWPHGQRSCHSLRGGRLCVWVMIGVMCRFTCSSNLFTTQNLEESFRETRKERLVASVYYLEQWDYGPFFMSDKVNKWFQHWQVILILIFQRLKPKWFQIYCYVQKS